MDQCRFGPFETWPARVGRPFPNPPEAGTAILANLLPAVAVDAAHGARYGVSGGVGSAITFR